MATDGNWGQRMNAGYTEVTQSYIVRVYRRSTQDPRKLDGIIEFVDEARAIPFHDLKTLCDAFVPRGTAATGAGS